MTDPEPGRRVSFARLRLQWRIALPFILIVLLVIGTVTAVAVQQGGARIEANLRDRQAVAAGTTAASLDQHLDGARRLLTATASSLPEDVLWPEIEPTRANVRFDPIIAFANVFQTLLLTDEAGTVQAARPDPPEGTNSIAEEAAFHAVQDLPAERLVLGSAFHPAYWIVPIASAEEGRPPRYLLGLLRLDTIEELLFLNIPDGSAALFRITGGGVVVSTEPDVTFRAPGSLSTQATAGPADLPGRIRALAPLASQLGEVLVVGEDEEVRELTFVLLRNSLLTAVLLIAGAVLLSVSLARLVARPVTKMQQATERMAEGDLTVRAEPEGAQEFRALAGSFNHMADALQRDRGALLALQAGLESRVTERTEELARQKEEMELFFYAVSHDFKSPTIAVRYYAEMLLEDLETGEVAVEGLRRMAERIVHSGKNLERLTQDILTFARIDRNVPRPERFRIDQLVAEVIAEQEPAAEVRAIRLEPSGPSIGFHSDPNRIRLAIANLVQNAVKYLPDRPGGRVVVRWDLVGGSLVIRVVDNGDGIPEPDQETLFLPFKRAKDADQRADGTGLGLSIVDRSVKSLGGHILLESSRAKGTSFTLTIPASPEAPP